MTTLTDDQQRALDDLLHWIWTFRRQLQRLLQGLVAEWTEPPPGRLQREQFSQTTADLTFMLLAAEHVCLALERARAAGFSLPTVDADQRELLKLLRNIYEHWTDYTPWDPAKFPTAGKPARSGVELLKRRPGAQPFSFRGDGVIGDCVDLNEFLRYVNTLETLARSLAGLPPIPTPVSPQTSEVM